MQIKQFFSNLLVCLSCMLVTFAYGQEGSRTVSEYEARQQAVDLARQAENNLRERERALRETIAKRDFYKEDLERKKNDKTFSKQDIRLTKLECNKANQEAETAERKVKNAKFWAKETRKMITMSKKKRDKVLLKYGIQPVLIANIDNEKESLELSRKMSKTELAERELAAIKTRERFEQNQPQFPVKVEGRITNPKLVTVEREQATETVITPNLITDLPQKVMRPNTEYAQYDPGQNTFLNPPIYECKFEYAGQDQFTGKERTDLKPETLFFYTDERLRPYLKDQDYLTGKVYLSRLEGGYHFLTLIIDIASKNAQLEYGSVERGSVLSFKTLEGKTIKLQANKTDEGQYNPRTDNFTYRVQYVISGGAKKMLETELIDQIRLTWSRGYEDYDIYAVDLIQQQFACLNE